MYDVFISCTSTDVKIADCLAAYLKYYNIDCFVAHRDIPADVPWAHGIAEAIKNSRIMIALFSEDFNTGVWMDDELNTANIVGVPILTFRLCDAPFSETKAVFLKSTACVESGEDVEGKFPIMYENVCNMLGLPIEQALPVAEVLIEKQPEAEKPTPKKEGGIQKQTTEAEKLTIETEEITTVPKNTIRSLLPAIVIGVVLMIIVKLFLDWALS